MRAIGGACVTVRVGAPVAAVWTDLSAAPPQPTVSKSVDSAQMATLKFCFTLRSYGTAWP